MKKSQIILTLIVILAVTVTALLIGQKLGNKNMDSQAISGQGWITVAPNKRYLMFEDGKPFFPLGVSMSGDHINMDYYGQAKIGGQQISFSDNHFEPLFQKMRANGENFLRIDIESVGAFPYNEVEPLVLQGKIQFLENPAGTFNEGYAKRIDRLVALAEKYDIYLDLSLTAHSCELTLKSADKFSLYPYSQDRGGPLRTFDELITNAEAKQLMLARLQYVSKRWGGSNRIAIWELYNELLNCGGKDPAAAENWVADMGRALRGYDQANWGKSHPIIVSTVDIVPTNQFFFASPGTDVMASHFYTDVNDSANPVTVALKMQESVREDLRKVQYGRPYIENERTLSKNYPEVVQQEVEHAAAWALASSGAANAGATWVRMGENSTFRTENVVASTHKAMRAILNTIDFSRFDSRPIVVPSSNPEIVPMVVSDGTQVLGWLLHNNPDDYDIENIDHWLGNGSSDPVITAQTVGKWIHIVDKYGGSPAVDAYFDKIGAMIAEPLGLSPAEASQTAKDILATPGKAAKFLNKLAAQRGEESMKQVVRQAFDQILSELKGLEASQGILKKAYRGHPAVTAELTISGLRPGSHRVTWYDDLTGKEIRRDEITGETVVVSAPLFSKHIAFTITQ